MSEWEALPHDYTDEELARGLHMGDVRLARLLRRGAGDWSGFTWEVFGEPTDDLVPMTDLRMMAPPLDPPARALDVWQFIVRHDSTTAYLEYRHPGRPEWDADPEAASDRIAAAKFGDIAIGEVMVRHVERATSTQVRRLLQGRRLLGDYMEDPVASARAARELKARDLRAAVARLTRQGLTNLQIADRLGFKGVDCERKVRQYRSEARAAGLDLTPR